MQKVSRSFIIIGLILVMITAACQMPALGIGEEQLAPEAFIQEEPQAEAHIAEEMPAEEPLPVQEPTVDLPPALVETDPYQNGVIHPEKGLTLYFNQAMDKDSVEDSLQFPAESQFDWLDEATLLVTPSQLLVQNEDIQVVLDVNAKAANGLSLQEPLSMQFSAPQSLSVVEQIPAPESEDVNPSSPVIVTFNQPVVPFSAGNDFAEPAFYLDPPSTGTGKWINTSTYMFTPDPPLIAGMPYRLEISGGLQSQSGGMISYDDESLLIWGFKTSEARLLFVEPEQGEFIDLDQEITLTFNQPMDEDSVKANLSLSDTDGNIYPGSLSWNETYTEAVFQPEELLPRAKRLSLYLSENVICKGGGQLAEGVLLNYVTYGRLAFQGTDPYLDDNQPLSIHSGYASIILKFSSPLAENQNWSNLIHLESKVGGQKILHNFKDTLIISGYFEANTTYTITISEKLIDAWGSKLGQTVIFPFKTENARPALALPTDRTVRSVLFLSPQDLTVNAQATNLNSLQISSKGLNLTQFITLLNAGYSMGEYAPETTLSWTQPLELQPNRSEVFDLQLTQDSSQLATGFYYYSIQTDPVLKESDHFLTIVSDTHLTIKHSEDQVLVWAVNMNDWTPRANIPLQFYNELGALVRSGSTDVNGVCKLSLPEDFGAQDTLLVMAGTPGEPGFGFTPDNWDSGLSAWEFDITSKYDMGENFAYLYTDRAIYKPGQTVNFRVIMRQEENGRYKRVSLDQITVDVKGSIDYMTGTQEVLESIPLGLSVYGSAQGSFILPEDMASGYYFLRIQEAPYYELEFQVAEYRKPEFQLDLQFDREAWENGDDLQASLQADYYFGAPAADLSVFWALYKKTDNLDMPFGYSVGLGSDGYYTSWLYPGMYSELGEYVIEGEGTTGPDGSLQIDIPYEELPESIDELELQKLTLEVTARDENEQPISARAETSYHPGKFYIGIRPDLWVGQAGSTMGFAIQTVDWGGNLSPMQELTVRFNKVDWVQEERDYVSPEPLGYIKTTELISSASLQTDLNGQARVSFTPPEPGRYELEVEGENALSRRSVYVGGEGRAVWPALPDQHLQLLSDQDNYQVGDAARIFFPNPFEGDAVALVTVERGEVMREYVIPTSGASYELSLPLSNEDAPNVYVSVTLLGSNADGQVDYRMGYLELEVEPAEQTLQVELLGMPSESAPGEEINLTVQVKDYLGNPVQGQFSLSLVDKAVLDLVEPNASGIIEAFYSPQPLGVFNSLSLVAHLVQLPELAADGVGGGGGYDEVFDVREDFKDTAYWNALIETDQNGIAEIQIFLPDNLTTWVADLRGLTQDTRVGEAVEELVTTKELLIRPVLPAFLVEGDMVELAAIVHNNSAQDLTGEVTIEAVGVELLTEEVLQRFSLPAGGQQKFTWLAKAGAVDQVVLLFTAQASDLQDTTRPQNGAIPILHYITPQTFGTSGVLTEETQRLEVVSLPRSFSPSAGSLQVETASSLASEILSGLKVLETYSSDYTESILSRLLPNIETWHALQDLGVEMPELQEKIDTEVSDGLESLLRLQNVDGGWGWRDGADSDLYISSYVLFGLSRAKELDLFVPADALEKAQLYMQSNLIIPTEQLKPWQYDRLAFGYFALKQSGVAVPQAAFLYDQRERMNPWAHALLALTLQDVSAELTQQLLSLLKGEAQRTATGAHWNELHEAAGYFSPFYQNTAFAVYALTRLDSQSVLLSEAVRYLVLNRRVDGGWSCSYDTAWVLLGLVETLKATGELEADFDYQVALNESVLLEGQAAAGQVSVPVSVDIPLSQLNTDNPNALNLNKTSPDGRLYYRSYLKVYQPVEDVEPIENGLSLTRQIEQTGADCPEEGCPVINRAVLSETEYPLTVRLILTVPQDMQYVMVEDFIPAGAEIVDRSLLTTQQGQMGVELEGLEIFWNRWIFGNPQIYSDHVLWVASYVPAGTYELTYEIIPFLPGEYRLLPAHAWQYYFPEVEASSAGAVFVIE